MGESGAGPITHLQVSDLPCRIAGAGAAGATASERQVQSRRLDGACKEQRKVDDVHPLRHRAATQALWPIADWAPKTYEEQIATGVMIGSGIGGLGGIADRSIVAAREGARRDLSPFFIPGRLINLARRLYVDQARPQGPEPCGGDGLLDRARMRSAMHRRLIALDDADVMIAGGTESADQPAGHRGLLRLPGAVDRLQRRPTKARRVPSTRDRDGFVMGEGAGASCWKNSSMPRRAAPRSMPKSWATACRATPTTSPRPSERRRWRIPGDAAALKRAGLAAEIDYVNAHGTSTPLGDEIELGAVAAAARLRPFRDSVDVLDQGQRSVIFWARRAPWRRSSAYAGDARPGIVPPTLNLDHPSGLRDSYRSRPASMHASGNPCSVALCRIPSALAARTPALVLRSIPIIEVEKFSFDRRAAILKRA